jgi:hypothetical protein
MRGLAANCAKMVRTLTFHAAQQSDHAKWRTYDFPAEWNLRSKRIAELVPHGSRVFEFGAGPVGLKPYLHPSCKLTSSDIVEHGPETKIIDLNRRPLPPLAEAQSQIAVFAGVLEYVSDVPSMVPWVAKHFELCVASYECAQPEPGFLGRIRESLSRTRMGWVNHFTETELKEIFAAVDFQFEEKLTWGTDDPGKIFVFAKRDPRGIALHSTGWSAAHH